MASETEAPYAVTDKAYAALIDLVTDICQRNNIKELKWKADKSLIGQVDKQNMTVHRWFANKSCPGEYLYDSHSQIAAEVNKRLNSKQEGKVMYRVQIGAFSKKENAENMLKKAKAAGFTDAFIATTIVESNAPEVETPKEDPKPTLLPLDEIAKQVINGKWGNGAERKQKLTDAGYDYKTVQNRVNELCRK